jgi:hypothetical protein
MTGEDKDKLAEATGSEESGLEPGFLARWSRRKLETEPLAQPQIEELVPASAAEIEAPEPPDSELTDADMPPLESLGEGSDYRGFLSPKVSEALRKAALRKLFSQSRFNVTDGLDDYAEDFTRFEPLGDLVTHEMRRMLESARKALTEPDDLASSSSPPGSVESGAEGTSKPGEEKIEQASGETDAAFDRDRVG